MFTLNWKKRYFKDKLRAVDKMIADLEFKRFKTREIREEVRQEYDNKRAALATLEQEIKQQATTPTMEKGEIARLDDKKALMEIDIKKHQDQMTMLDVEVSGQKPTNDAPEGVQGINEQLDAFRQLTEMIRDYIKTL